MDSPYEEIKKIKIHQAAFTKTREWLYSIGKRQYEVVVLWAGFFESEIEFLIDTPILPNQKSYKTSSGVCYKVPGDEIFNISYFLYKSGRELIAQIHTHPQDAFHSSHDERYPLVTAVGQFSFVVPRFATHFDKGFEGCCVFRLSCEAFWEEIQREEFLRMFSII
jgi:hypothetical protein